MGSSNVCNVMALVLSLAQKTARLQSSNISLKHKVLGSGVMMLASAHARALILFYLLLRVYVGCAK